MLLRNNPEVNVRAKGIRFPGVLNAHVRQLHSIHKRLSKIELSSPLTAENIPQPIAKRIMLFREAEKFNRINFPGFLPTAYGLHLFKTI
jgi:hypothetical protein